MPGGNVFYRNTSSDRSHAGDAQFHHFAGLPLFDQLNEHQHTLSRSTSGRSQALHNGICEHIRIFWKKKISEGPYERMRLSVFDSLPDYSQRAVRMIDMKLEDIQRRTREHLQNTYNLIQKLVGLLESMVMPGLLSLMPDAAGQMVKKILTAVIGAVRYVTKDIVGVQSCAITKIFVKHQSKNAINGILQNPLGTIINDWQDNNILEEEDIMSELLKFAIENVVSVIGIVQAMATGDVPPVATPAPQQTAARPGAAPEQTPETTAPSTDWL